MSPLARGVFFFVVGMVAAEVGSSLVAAGSLAHELMFSAGCLVTVLLDVVFRVRSSARPLLLRLVDPGAGGRLSIFPVWTLAAMAAVVGVMNAHR